MKSIKIFKHAAVIAMLMISSTVLAQDKIIPYADVPAGIKEYIKTHFPSHTVVQSEIDMEGLLKHYEINLSNNLKVKFNHKHRVIEIDGSEKLPDSVIPKKIRDYVSANYPANFITDWEIDWIRQQVELNNGIELEFTTKGNFLRIDN